MLYFIYRVNLAASVRFNSNMSYTIPYRRKSQVTSVNLCPHPDTIVVAINRKQSVAFGARRCTSNKRNLLSQQRGHQQTTETGK